MRISDWSSDVCSSDLGGRGRCGGVRAGARRAPLRPPPRWRDARCADHVADRREPVVGTDRKSVVSGKCVSVRVDLGGRRIIKKKKCASRILHRSHSPTQSKKTINDKNKLKKHT